MSRGKSFAKIHVSLTENGVGLHCSWQKQPIVIGFPSWSSRRHVSGENYPRRHVPGKSNQLSSGKQSNVVVSAIGCHLGLVCEHANEIDIKSYSIEGFAWVFKTWILESFRAATDDYYTRYRHHPRIVAWSSKRKSYRNMLKPMLHGNYLFTGLYRMRLRLDRDENNRFMIPTDPHIIGTLDGSVRLFSSWNDVTWVYMPINAGGVHWVTEAINLTDSIFYVFDSMKSESRMLMLEQQGWCRTTAIRAYEGEVEGCILVDMLDRWFWALEGSGEFTITSVRKMIDDFMLPEVSSKTR
nr:RNA-directed DNA polymerase, eukaryota [Tanacetum cinerariifolium]